jgi:hypothetical protein
VGLLKLFLTFLLLTIAGSSARADQIAIVVGPEVALENLSFSEVRQIFIGSRQFWSPNLRVTLLMQAPGAREREAALKTIYQMSEAQFRQYWISKVFRAEVPGGPKVLYSHQTTLEMLFAIPGAVALVEASQVPKNLKILKIDGRLPGQGGYKLP